MVNWSLTKLPEIDNGQRIVSSANDVVKTGYPCAKEWNWIILHHTQTSPQNGLNT